MSVGSIASTLANPLSTQVTTTSIVPPGLAIETRTSTLSGSTLAGASQSSLPPISLAPLVTNGLEQPTHVTNAGDGSDRLFVVERAGRIRIIDNGTLVSTPFLDISALVGDASGEQGLLSVAFPDNYESQGSFYVNYTNTAGDTVIARYQVSSNANVANANSGTILLTIDQPFANHNGGQLAFGADGYLYIGMGDGGGAGDPQNNAQNPASLLGKLLRIDVSAGAATYSIPTTNPFVGNDPGNYRDEIWASGLRNPWRFSFDRRTGDLYLADVGQGDFEEINYQLASSQGGENYGWKIMEGFSRYDNTPGDLTGLVRPVSGYDHSQGASITGGFVYRGPDLSVYQGTYFYADFVNGKIWGLQQTGNTWQNTLLLDTTYNISSFGEDESGNLYVADYDGGIYQIQIPSTTSNQSLIWRNSETGTNTSWLLNNSTFVGDRPLPEVADPNWTIVDVHDFDRNGEADLLWRNQLTGDNTFWLRNGTNPIVSRSLPRVADVNWEIVGIQDFNRDSKPDLLWRNRATGDNVLWRMDDTSPIDSQPLPSVPDLNWVVEATVDFDQNTQPDVLWHNRATGETVIWLFNDTSPIAARSLPQVADTRWEIVGASDFNQNGQPDLLWRNRVTGENVIWLLNGTTALSSQALPQVADTNWTIQGITDFNSDGSSDLFWRNSATGENLVWQLSGTTPVSTESLPFLRDPGWSVQVVT